MSNPAAAPATRNPYPTTPTTIDIRETSGRVIALLEQQRSREALELLERSRQNERPVVQEALDRYVVAGFSLQNLRADAPGDLTPTLTRLDSVLAADPRYPIHNFLNGTQNQDRKHNELEGLTEAQVFDVYASMVRMHGDQAARDALDRQGDRVILGLRQEDRTTVSMPGSPDGQGVYNDRLVVMWTEAGGNRRVHEALRANTEPTAQYDHHAGSNGHRQNDTSGVPVAPSPGFEGVTVRRKIEGVDIDGDGVQDLGRLADGTIEMRATTHANPGNLPRFSLRPTPAAVAAGQGHVQRDTSGDGYFTGADIHGVDDLNYTFKIHIGSRLNTDSAGCQTMHFDDYKEFLDAVTGAQEPDPENYSTQRWQYVLVTTSPGLFRDTQSQVQSTEEITATPAAGPGQPQTPVPPPSPAARGAVDNPQASREPESQLSPMLQRLYDAGISGNRADMDRAMSDTAQSFFASRDGQQFAHETNDRINELLAAERAQQEQQVAVTAPSRGRSR